MLKEGKSTYHSRSLLREETIRRVHPFCTFAPNPSTEFEKQCEEIALSESTCVQLTRIFADSTRYGLYYLPKELIQLCVSYARVTVESTVSHILDLCREFREAGGFVRIAGGSGLLKVLSETWEGGCDLDHIAKCFGNPIDNQCFEYLWWFRMRQIVPKFISLNHIRSRNSMQNIVTVHFDLEQARPIYFLAFCSLSLAELKGIPYSPLIGPCLNTSKVRLWDIATATFNLSRRNACWIKRKVDLFNLLIALAAIQLWIADLENFKELPAPKIAQQICQIEWNLFHQTYHFGDPFVLS
jgi:hypothetical protein